MIFREKINFFFKKIKQTLFNIKDHDLLIPGEILNDQFSELIKNIASKTDVKKIIEIGSSSGTGSTKYFINTLKRRKDIEEISFICMEISNIRFKKLQNYLAPYKFAKAYNLSSVDISSFPSEAEIIDFYKSRKTNLNKYSLNKILKWRQQDIDYINSTGRNICGIQAIKKSLKIKVFDLCLIDGSEFTGKEELNYFMGSKYILLDDTESYKCREAFEILEKREDYQLIEYKSNCRNGFAAFKKL